MIIIISIIDIIMYLYDYEYYVFMYHLVLLAQAVVDGVEGAGDWSSDTSLLVSRVSFCSISLSSTFSSTTIGVSMFPTVLLI